MRGVMTLENVAVFGASSAIASEVARLYAKRGARLYLVARNATKLQLLANELSAHVLGSAQQDFDRTEQAQACVDDAVRALGHIDIAIIAHGLLGDQRGSELDLNVAEQIARSNYLSVVALLMPLANHLEARQSGHLAVLSTVAADRGRPRNYTYAAGKSALNTYLQGLRSRLYRARVHVHTIKLGPVDSPMTTDHEKTALFATVERAASGIVRAIDRGVAEAYVPGFWRAIMFVVRNLPEAVLQRVPALRER
jgi:decaprenylphospho-beta-D-erythro-pentofuranosid-2-ulose 2-reductase